jgi:hypothetical protein
MAEFKGTQLNNVLNSNIDLQAMQMEMEKFLPLTSVINFEM